MFPKQDIAKPRTPEDVVRAYGLKRGESQQVIQQVVQTPSTPSTPSIDVNALKQEIIRDVLATIPERFGVQKISFTDRPTAWEWLKSNYQKVIKATLSANIIPAPIAYQTCCAVQNSEEIASISFSLVNPLVVINRYAELCIDLFEITGSEVYVNVGSNFVGIGQDYTNSTGDGVTELPDEYWAAVSAELTCYYFE